MLTENREFNEIYEQYKNLILKAAYTYSGSYSAAEDITQDTFLKLYMGYDSIKIFLHGCLQRQKMRH